LYVASNNLEFSTARKWQKGPVFEKLLNRWSKNVGLDIEKQIKAFNAEMTTTGSGASPYKFAN
jgi:hypothetical protein